MQLLRSKLAVSGHLSTNSHLAARVLRSPDATSFWLRRALSSADGPVLSAAPRRALAPSLAIFLHLVPVVIVAGVTVVVFFGVAFSLAWQPANTLVAGWLIRGDASDVGSAARGSLPRGGATSSNSVALPASAKTARPPAPAPSTAMPARPQNTAVEKPSEVTARIIPAPNPLAGQLAELLARGDFFLRAGDIASARLFYERAAEAGDAQAALELGATFDPYFLVGVGLRNMRGDAAKAVFWYHRALGLGANQAQLPLIRLETK